MLKTMTGRERKTVSVDYFLGSNLSHVLVKNPYLPTEGI